MLDIETLRVTLGAVSLLVLVLFYLGVFRPTRSAFSGWWTLALLSSGTGTLLLLLNGTPVQVIASPIQSVASVIGATCVWFATRSLRGQRLPLWLLPLCSAGILAVAMLQNPGVNIWAGDGPLFAYMAAMFLAASLEMWRSWRGRRGERDRRSTAEASVALLVSALAASTLAGFYLLRVTLYFVVGPESPVFERFVGTGATSAILLLCLVAVTFSVSAIGWDQQTRALRRRAMEDDLTGLLGRAEFWARAEETMPGAGRDALARPMLVLADLDHFKAVNDRFGHAAGDEAIIEFAGVLRSALRPGEIAGRLGGEEFGIVLDDADGGVASRIEGLAAAFARRTDVVEFALPTVSFGLATHVDADGLDDMFRSADAALYRAKSNGRNQAVMAGDED